MVTIQKILLLCTFWFINHIKLYHFLVSKLPTSSTLSEENTKSDVEVSKVDPIDVIIKPFEEIILHPYEVIVERNFPKECEGDKIFSENSDDFHIVIERLGVENERSYRKRLIHLISCLFLILHSYVLFTYSLYLWDFTYFEIFGYIQLVPDDENEPFMIL